MRYLLITVILLSMLAVPSSGIALSTALPPAPAEARLLFVGDIMLGRYVRTSLAARGYDPAFDGVRAWLSSADLSVGNLEGPLVPTNYIPIPRPAPNNLNLTGDARSAPALARAGFDLLSLANNHSYDAGAPGLKSTVAALRSVDIGPLGLDQGGGQQPVVKHVKGLNVAFLAYTTVLNTRGTGISYINPNSERDLARFQGEIAASRRSADVVIVVMHWGNEYAVQPNVDQRRLSDLAAHVGADLVVGAHPHVAQGMDVKNSSGRTTVIAYSLGNALFDQVRADTQRGLALECIIDRNGVKLARFIPLQIVSGAKGYAMQIATPAIGQVTLSRAAQSTPASLQWKSLDSVTRQPGLEIAYRRKDSATASSLEELGMGASSRVELRDGGLSVSRPGASGKWQRVWSSEPGWRVTGYTVGDADADGRPELIYTLWKPRLVWYRPPDGGMSVDQNGGEVLPHIYINGWRGGALRPVWHGSPRPSPVLAVAVAAVGEKGKPLLAALESSNTAREQTPGVIKLWEWSGGFGYQLVTSLPGAYSEMWSDGKVLLFH